MVHGTCTDAFLPLRDLLQQNLTSGEDAGASVAVVPLVVDLWGSEARPGVLWERDSAAQGV